MYMKLHNIVHPNVSSELEVKGGDCCFKSEYLHYARSWNIGDRLVIHTSRTQQKDLNETPSISLMASSFNSSRIKKRNEAKSNSGCALCKTFTATNSSEAIFGL